MARIHTAERMLQGQPLSSFDAFACTPGYLDHEAKPERRWLAEAGNTVVRW
jgi:hypothetical protein